MKFKDLLKLACSGTLGFMTYDSWRISRQSVNNQAEVETLNKALTNLKSDLLQISDKYIENSDKLQFIKGRALHFNSDYSELLKQRNEINHLIELLKKAKTDSEKSSILNKIDYNKALLDYLTKKSLESGRELYDKVLNIENIDPQSGEIISQSHTKYVEGHVDSTENMSDINESNVLGSFTELMDAIKNELSNLSSEQLACLFNSIGFFMIFTAFSSIIIILFGEYLINKLKLETRFPRLAKYIKIRQTLNKYYLFFNILLIYLIIIIFIFINISMLLG